MGTSGYFGTENYAWKVAIVQILCEYCWLFLCAFLCLTCLDTPNTQNTDLSNVKVPFSEKKGTLNHFSWKTFLWPFLK